MLFSTPLSAPVLISFPPPLYSGTPQIVTRSSEVNARVRGSSIAEEKKDTRKGKGKHFRLMKSMLELIFEKQNFFAPLLTRSKKTMSSGR